MSRISSIISRRSSGVSGKRCLCAWSGFGAAKPAKADKAPKAAIYQSEAKPPSAKHPKHVGKVWLTTHKGRTFRVIQLPRCEHMEAVLSYEPSGETKEQAKERVFPPLTGQLRSQKVTLVT